MELESTRISRKQQHSSASRTLRDCHMRRSNQAKQPKHIQVTAAAAVTWQMLAKFTFNESTHQQIAYRRCSVHLAMGWTRLDSSVRCAYRATKNLPKSGMHFRH